MPSAISGDTEIAAGDVTVATIAQAASDPARYRIVGYDASAGEPADLTLAQAVEARAHRAGSPAAAVACRRALEFAAAAGHQPLGAGTRAGGRPS